MANWKRIEQLRDHIAVRGRKIDMGEYICIDRKTETIGQAREARCGTAGCIAGWAAIMWLSPQLVVRQVGLDHGQATVEGVFDIEQVAAEELGLTNKQANHCFYAEWHPNKTYVDDISKKDVIAYLTKAIKAKDIMVRL